MSAAGVLVLLVALLHQADSVASPLKRLIEKGRHPAIRWGRFVDVQADARRLYELSDWKPLWLTEGGALPNREARALLDALATAGDRGLDPQDYDAAQLTALAANLSRGGADREQAIRFDAALTIGALRFVRALARGRVGTLAAGSVPSHPEFDPTSVVDALRRTERVEPILTALEPAWPAYAELKRALVRYRQLMKDSVGGRAMYAARIRQIELALERWRWIPRGFRDSALLVTAPAFRLHIPVGTTPPMTIRMGVRIEHPRCRAISVFAHELRMIVFQPAGRAAAVGFPLAGGVDLTGGLPGELSRPGEASCVRVADGELLAELLLRGRPDWTRERIRAAMSGDRQVFVRLPRSVPVFFVYATAVADESGRVSFFPDALGHDAMLDRLLRLGYPFPR